MLSMSGCKNQSTAEIESSSAAESGLNFTGQEYDSYFICGKTTAGVNFYAPEGLSDISHSAAKAEMPGHANIGKTYMLKSIPVDSGCFSIESQTTGDLMQFYVQSGSSDDEFKKTTKESAEKAYLTEIPADGWERNFRATASEFELFEIQGYPAYKLVMNVTEDDYKREIPVILPYEITVVCVNAAKPECDHGFKYTFTYYDYSGKIKDTIQYSIDSIDLCNPLWETYEDPYSALTAQKIED